MSERTPLHHTTADPRELITTFVRAGFTGVTGADDLLALARAERLRHPEVRILLTLDDLAQCHYTSMHALEDDLLYVEEPDGIDIDDPEQVHAWEGAQLRHLAAQLRRPDLHPAWAELEDRDAGPAGVRALIAANADVTTILDDQVQALHLPVERDDEVIAGLPNGYFGEDWDVFANHTVSTHLAQRFGYRHLGIGASWLAFERDGGLSAEQAADLAAELTPVYGDHPGWAEFAETMTGRELLLLGYTGNFAD